MKRPLFFYIYRIVELQSDGAAVLPAAGSGAGSFLSAVRKKTGENHPRGRKVNKVLAKGFTVEEKDAIIV